MQEITTGPDYGGEAQQILTLARDLTDARNELLRAFGTPGYEKTKKKIITLLWDNKMLIIHALCKAAGK